MNNDLVERVITVSSLSQKATQFATKFILEHTNEKGRTEKYYFYDKKKDGTDSAAYTAFVGNGVRIGDVLALGVKEEQKSFQGEDGKEVVYTDRRIMTLKKNA